MWFESRPVRTSASGPPSSLPAAAFPVLPNPVFLRLPQPPAGAQAALPPPVLCAHGTPDPAQSAGPAGPPGRVFLALRPPGQRWERAEGGETRGPGRFPGSVLVVQPVPGLRPSHLRTELSGRWGSGRREGGSPGWGGRRRGRSGVHGGAASFHPPLGGTPDARGSRREQTTVGGQGEHSCAWGLRLPLLAPSCRTFPLSHLPPQALAAAIS